MTAIPLRRESGRFCAQRYRLRFVRADASSMEAAHQVSETPGRGSGSRSRLWRWATRLKPGARASRAPKPVCEPSYRAVAANGIAAEWASDPAGSLPVSEFPQVSGLGRRRTLWPARSHMDPLKRCAEPPAGSRGRSSVGKSSELLPRMSQVQVLPASPDVPSCGQRAARDFEMPARSPDQATVGLGAARRSRAQDARSCRLGAMQAVKTPAMNADGTVACLSEVVRRETGLPVEPGHRPTTVSDFRLGGMAMRRGKHSTQTRGAVVGPLARTGPDANDPQPASRIRTGKAPGRLRAPAAHQPGSRPAIATEIRPAVHHDFSAAFPLPGRASGWSSASPAMMALQMVSLDVSLKLGGSVHAGPPPFYHERRQSAGAPDDDPTGAEQQWNRFLGTRR